MHTPTPWKASIRGEAGETHIRGKTGAYICGLEWHSDAPDDADFIVKAVNNHQKLVEALRTTAGVLAVVSKLGEPGSNIRAVVAEDESLLAELDD